MESAAQESSESKKDAGAGDGTEDQQPKAEEVPVITPEERLWGVVKANPADFNAWTELIQETEKLEDIVRLRTCYDAFLAEFPLCYGYWKKYADFEARFGSPEKIVEVYERAVKAVTHSVDIWMHYCTYAAEKLIENTLTPEEMLRLFERAVSFVGTDYLSHSLWDKFIEFAYRQQDWNLVMQLHSRILETPLQQLDRFYTSFKLPKEADDGEKFLAGREALYKKTKEWDAKIRDFENAIRRPYFHVKPLDDAQLGNWHRYLDFLEKEGDVQKVVKVFERCLIACANYPEYWIRYVEYLEKQNNLEMANDALLRASQTFVKRLPEIHIFAARFRERTGEIPAARKTYRYITTELSPGHLEAIVKSAHFEKRQGDVEGGCSVFESAIEMESTKGESRTLPFIYVQYIQFLDRVGRVAKAKEVLEAALQKLPSSKIVFETAIHYEYHTKDKQLEKLYSRIQQATKAEDAVLSHADREELSSIYLEFIDAFGDIKAVMDAESCHEGFFPFRKSYIDIKRRLAHDSSFSDRAKLLKGLSPAAAQGYGQTQWTAATYGAQAYPQNWQQTPQAQWSTYTQPQAGYAYGSYSAYAAQPGQAGYTAYTAASQDMNGTWPSTGTTQAW